MCTNEGVSRATLDWWYSEQRSTRVPSVILYKGKRRKKNLYDSSGNIEVVEKRPFTGSNKKNLSNCLHVFSIQLTWRVFTATSCLWWRTQTQMGKLDENIHWVTKKDRNAGR